MNDRFADAVVVGFEIGEGAFAADHIAGELGDVVSGRVTGRASTAQVTLFKSLGMAVEDVVAERSRVAEDPLVAVR